MCTCVSVCVRACMRACVCEEWQNERSYRKNSERIKREGGFDEWI